MAHLKYCNRHHALASQNKNERVTEDKVLVTIMADLQQIQDGESDVMLKQSLEMVLRIIFF